MRRQLIGMTSIACLMSVGVAGGVARESHAKVTAKGPLIEALGSADVVRVITTAETVRAYRVGPPREFQKNVSDYKMASGPVKVSKSEVAKLRKVLLDVDTYEFELAKGCIPQYGVRVAFEHGSEKVDVLFCFECQILTVYHNGRVVGGEDFDGGYTQLLGVIQRVFPDDEAIRKLSE